MNSTYMVYFFGKMQNEKSDCLIPFKEIRKNSKIVVFGAGSVGENIVSYLNCSDDFEMCAWIDSKGSEKKLGQWKVQSPDKIKDIVFDYIILATNRTMYIREMRERLQDLGIQKEKIVSAFDSL